MTDRSTDTPVAATSAPPERLMRWFGYQHLPERLQAVSKPFCDLASQVVDTIPPSPERTVCLRKLLEAKDAGVRAFMEGGG